MKSEYINPIINMDISDPDIVPYKNGYLMIASSFNFVPGLPIYYSSDLVNWKFVNFIVNKLPTKKYNNVHFGHGIWAPSIREYKGTYYVLFPTPDEGIFVCKSKNPLVTWSKPKRLIKIKGYEDPCPIWYKGKTYVVHAFVKSRIGFNSKLAIFETDSKLTRVLSESKIIYDGTIENKTIEGPKFNIINDELFILAPAGGVETGYQVALKANDIYGKYDYKIILKGYEDTINGPHQGALVEYKKNKYVFYHFQYKGALGRVLHLEPVVIEKGYPIAGEKRHDGNSAPVKKHEYFLKKLKLDENNNRLTVGDFLNNFTYACNKPNNSYEITKNVFVLHTFYSKKILLNKNSIYKAIPDSKFKFESYLSFSSLKENEEAGIVVLGLISYVLSYKNGLISIYMIDMENMKKQKMFEKRVRKDYFKFKLCCNNLLAQFYVDNKKIGNEFSLSKGKWVGSKVGLFSISEIKKEKYGSLIVYSSFIK